MTARRVAAQRLTFTRVESGDGQPDADDRLQADVASGIDATETPLTPYLRSRTAFFDRVVVESLAAGVTQVVMVGAGYDGRSLRYAKAGVRWFELDHPDTQADKTARLQRLGIDTGDVVFVPVDFVSGDVADALARAGYNRGAPSLFCCEGVAGYLPTDVMTSLLQTLAEQAAKGSSLAVSMALEPVTAEGTLRRERLGVAVASVGEPLVSTVPRADLRASLAAAGWTVDRATDPSGVDISTSQGNSAFVVAVR
jgi:methyltransferase (TIGR00027 family)